MDAVVASAASVGGRAELPRQLLEPMQRQLELVQEVIERERRLQTQLAAHVLAPAGRSAGGCRARARGDRRARKEPGRALRTNNRRAARTGRPRTGSCWTRSTRPRARRSPIPSRPSGLANDLEPHCATERGFRSGLTGSDNGSLAARPVSPTMRKPRRGSWKVRAWSSARLWGRGVHKAACSLINVVWRVRLEATGREHFNPGPLF